MVGGPIVGDGYQGGTEAMPRVWSRWRGRTAKEIWKRQKKIGRIEALGEAVAQAQVQGNGDELPRSDAEVAARPRYG
jgi:hypothetical protein